MRIVSKPHDPTLEGPGDVVCCSCGWSGTGTDWLDHDTGLFFQAEDVNGEVIGAFAGTVTFIHGSSRTTMFAHSDRLPLIDVEVYVSP